MSKLGSTLGENSLPHHVGFIDAKFAKSSKKWPNSKRDLNRRDKANKATFNSKVATETVGKGTQSSVQFLNQGVKTTNLSKAGLQRIECLRNWSPQTGQTQATQDFDKDYLGSDFSKRANLGCERANTRVQLEYVHEDPTQNIAPKRQYFRDTFWPRFWCEG